MRYCTLDLEIHDDLEEGKDYEGQGISCASIAFRNEKLGGHITTEDFYRPDFGRFDQDDVYALASRLQDAIRAGYTLATFNGLGFDFRVMSIEGGKDLTCFLASIALAHIDPMFNVVCALGWPVGLQQVCEGMQVTGKVHDVTLKSGETIHDMHGSKAPGYWRAGEHEAVLTYLRGDVFSLLVMLEAVEQRRSMFWRSQKGRPYALPRSQALATVQHAMTLPVPDTSWMTRPMLRSHFTDWMNLEAKADPEPEDDPNEGMEPVEDMGPSDDLGPEQIGEPPEFPPDPPEFPGEGG